MVVWPLRVELEKEEKEDEEEVVYVKGILEYWWIGVEDGSGREAVCVCVCGCRADDVVWKR